VGAGGGRLVAKRKEKNGGQTIEKKRGRPPRLTSEEGETGGGIQRPRFCPRVKKNSATLREFAPLGVADRGCGFGEKWGQKNGERAGREHVYQGDTVSEKCQP